MDRYRVMDRDSVMNRVKAKGLWIGLGISLWIGLLL
jgi:hypothetical protein